MNLNALAKEITLIEGMRRSVSIAQVKEILRITLIKLAEADPQEVEKILKRYR